MSEPLLIAVSGPRSLPEASNTLIGHFLADFNHGTNDGAVDIDRLENLRILRRNPRASAANLRLHSVDDA